MDDTQYRPDRDDGFQEEADEAPVATGALIRVAAVVLRDEQGRVLTVRKSGTRRFMQPGGKPEPGEGAVDAGIRECHEELGLRLKAGQLDHMGTFRAAAAHEPGHVVEAEVFCSTERLTESPHPRAEIAEIRWVEPDEGLPRDEYADLFLDHIIPALRRST